MASSSGPTEVIELTPRGRGAVAVVVAAGPKAVAVVGACFHAANGRALAEQTEGRIVLGRWGGADGEELVVCRRAADRVEVHCHGGTAAIGVIVEQLVASGCRATSWQEWTRRTEGDPIASAARVALADATTGRTAAVLIDQLQGALGASIRAALDAIETQEWPAAAAALGALVEFEGVGRHLTRPWRVVLAGRPNVGKSSLINALVGHERAIVCDLPGTTRDVVTAVTAIDGWPIELADTAGLRATAEVAALDSIESAGAARAEAALAAADLVVLVFDATAAGGAAAGRYEFETAIPSTARVLRVLNKIDLLAESPQPAADWLPTSATTGQGIDALVTAIGQSLVPRAPAAGAAVPFEEEQIEAIGRAMAAVARRDAAGARAALQSLLPQ